jgi:hypothetical protein
MRDSRKGWTGAVGIGVGCVAQDAFCGLLEGR